jgi:histidine triad (HIT) family protein
MEDTDCLFCRVVSGDVPADVVRETDHSVAFRDIDPQAPTHVLVVPRRHFSNAAELADASPEGLADLVTTARDVAGADGVAESGYRLVFNTGAGAHQTVFHAHVHVLGGRTMTWPPG